MARLCGKCGMMEPAHTGDCAGFGNKTSILESEYKALQTRVKELERELYEQRKNARRDQDEMARCHSIEIARLQKLVDMDEKVVNEAREVVFGQSADSIDSDKYPELEKALRERDTYKTGEKA